MSKDIIYKGGSILIQGCVQGHQEKEAGRWPAFCPGSTACSVLSPLVPALCALVKGCHGFISRSDLKLEEVRMIVATRLHGTLCNGLVNIIPRTLASENVIDGFARQLAPLVQLHSADGKLVGTSGAAERVGPRCAGS